MSEQETSFEDDASFEEAVLGVPFQESRTGESDPVGVLEEQAGKIEEELIDPKEKAEQLGVPPEDVERLSLLYNGVKEDIRAAMERTLAFARAGVLAATIAGSPALANTEPLPEEVVSTQEVDSGVVTEESQAVTVLESLSVPSAAEQSTREKLKEEGRQVEEIINAGFKDREHLADFYVDLARTSGVEYAVSYGVNPDGKIEVLHHLQGGDNTFVIPDEKRIMESARAKGITQLRFLHTHPAMSMKDHPDQELSPDHPMPFSVPDLNTAIRSEWRNRYMETTKWMDAIPGTYSFTSEIADSTGIWKYDVDINNPYIQGVLSAREDHAADTNQGILFLKEHPEMSRDEFKEMIRTIASPDTLVSERAIEAAEARGLLKDSSILNSLIRYQTSGMTSDGEEYDLTKMQIEVNEADEEHREEAIAKFIAYFKERGINIEYTPAKE